MSEQNFKIEQGVRQGGVLSADLYKLYINPLLNFLDDSGLGGKIGILFPVFKNKGDCKNAKNYRGMRNYSNTYTF